MFEVTWIAEKLDGDRYMAALEFRTSRSQRILDIVGALNTDAESIRAITPRVPFPPGA